ncbi:hypothetical protein [Nannocystis pusilla]|uniref:hypothetical protein n=1 Tax=Nannocystis pusilla TaxID=889268 RepID=UPI003B7F894D
MYAQRHFHPPLALALSLSCGDDEPKRPEDGTVKVWESCAWDGQVLPQLCEPDLVCTYHGVCAPACEMAQDCPTFDGFEMVCGPMEADNICKPKCNAKNECPKTGGVELHCLDFFCIGDS